MKRAILLSVLFIAALGLSGCSYNDLTAKQQQIKGRWANVESNLQSRNDLIPNLVEAAKLAGIQEQEVFGKIADARSKLLGAQSAPPQGLDGDKSPEQKQQVIEANNGLGAVMGRLLVLQEAYPQLRSNESFLKLQDSIEGTERRINVARLDYNDAVTAYNTTRNSFPTVVTASLFGFKEEPFFKADEGATKVPKIDSNSLRAPTTQPAAPAPANPAPANVAPVKP